MARCSCLQGLKADILSAISGTTEVAPFHKTEELQ
jgi:hypothetical protein